LCSQARCIDITNKDGTKDIYNTISAAEHYGSPCVMSENYETTGPIFLQLAGYNEAASNLQQLSSTAAMLTNAVICGACSELVTVHAWFRGVGRSRTIKNCTTTPDENVKRMEIFCTHSLIFHLLPLCNHMRSLRRCTSAP
jgi:hypothetical protein